MTKVIGAIIILGVLYGGWELFFYWERVKNEEVVQQKQAAAAVVVGESLEGVPQPLQASLATAEAQGAAALGNWLKVNDRLIQDPRKAWIQLDYCLLLSRENTAEAKRIFAEVKKRTPESSPVWPRIKKLENAYE
ncbi:MAG TPA: hypothetical protein VKY92_12075 [Verrucomicrobiae bacterium]|nr:hypothetical protein [Verrucomicrobiae bacterium]